MVQADEEPTRARVLDLIAEKGPVSAAQLAKVLQLTPAAVRRHITSLEEEGQIEVHSPAASGKALRYLSQVAGEGAVDSFAAARGRDLERRYSAAVEAAGKDPGERARALADALTLDGYAASVRDVGDGSYAVQLCQGHCPVREVAGEFHELCDAETQAISRLVGVPVQRLATLAGGEHVCTTHIPIAMPALRKRAVRAARTRSQQAKRTEGTR